MSNFYHLMNHETFFNNCLKLIPFYFPSILNLFVSLCFRLKQIQPLQAKLQTPTLFEMRANFKNTRKFETIPSSYLFVCSIADYTKIKISIDCCQNDAFVMMCDLEMNWNSKMRNDSLTKTNPFAFWNLLDDIQKNALVQK